MTWQAFKYWWQHDDYRELNQWATVVMFFHENGHHYRLTIGPTVDRDLNQIRSSHQNAEFYVEWSKLFVVTDDSQILGRQSITDIKLTNVPVTTRWSRTVHFNFWSSGWKRQLKNVDSSPTDQL